MSRVKNKSILRAFLRAPIHLYRLRLGFLLGHRFLLLTHTGRITGRRFQTVLEVMEYRERSHEAVVMSGFGRSANWLRNVETNGWAEINIGSEDFRASFRFLDEDDAMRVVAAYERHNQFMLPVVKWVLSRLLGWKYTATEPDRRRLVRNLPLIGFRPQSEAAN
jgi:deazaflavin-dependent oxidoreductase (nitroreductase family)